MSSVVSRSPSERKRYSFLSADLLAGLSIAGLLLPEAVTYSGIAGLPPQAGSHGPVRWIVQLCFDRAQPVCHCGGDILFRRHNGGCYFGRPGILFLAGGAAKLGGLSNLIPALCFEAMRLV